MEYPIISCFREESTKPSTPVHRNKAYKALSKPLIKKIITYNVRKQSFEVQIKSLLRCIPSKHTLKIFGLWSFNSIHMAFHIRPLIFTWKNTFVWSSTVMPIVHFFTFEVRWRRSVGGSFKTVHFDSKSLNLTSN